MTNGHPAGWLKPLLPEVGAALTIPESKEKSAMSGQEIALHQPLSAPLPLSKGEAVKHLSACLALVRPVGMNDDSATEWLAVAAAEVLELTRAQFEAGCRDARQTCTHHGQILPTILRHKAPPEHAMADRYIKDWHKALDDASKGYPAVTYDGGPKRLGDVIKRLERD